MIAAATAIKAVITGDISYSDLFITGSGASANRLRSPAVSLWHPPLKMRKAEHLLGSLVPL
jgi:hypothetical protein